MNVLERIVEATREEVAPAPARGAAGRARAAPRRARRGPAVPEALARPGVSVIAEHKRRSPSAGEIRARRDGRRGRRAPTSAAARPRCRSSPRARTSAARWTTCARRARASALPILRKDFIVDAYQVVESAAAGADALLLIVAALEPRRARRAATREARALDLDVLVEVHDEEELERALEVVDADVIGINNRDLTDFTVDLERTYELLADVPAGKTVVSRVRHPHAASSSTSSSASASTPCSSGRPHARRRPRGAPCRALRGDGDEPSSEPPSARRLARASGPRVTLAAAMQLRSRPTVPLVLAVRRPRRRASPSGVVAALDLGGGTTTTTVVQQAPLRREPPSERQRRRPHRARHLQARRAGRRLHPRRGRAAHRVALRLRRARRAARRGHGLGLRHRHATARSSPTPTSSRAPRRSRVQFADKKASTRRSSAATRRPTSRVLQGRPRRARPRSRCSSARPRTSRSATRRSRSATPSASTAR